MESRARYVLIGLFIFATIVGGFGFAYWLHTMGGFGDRSIYKVRFENTVSGLRVGAAVLFNGVRVGEVTKLELSSENPQHVFVTADIDRHTPIKADTQARIEVQGLMGSPSVALHGGSPSLPPLTSLGAQPPVLVAAGSAGQDVTQSARQVLGRVDTILAENSEPLHNTITNIENFSAALSRNSGRIDGILAGLEKMTGGAVKPPLPTFDLAAPHPSVPRTRKSVKQLVIADPTTLVAIDTQRILVKKPDGENSFLDNAQWADSLPKLFQAKIIESFENANSLSVSRPMDGLATDFQLLIDLREFRVLLDTTAKAEIEFIAKLLSKGGRIIDSKVFRSEAPIESLDGASVVEAFNKSFLQTATDLVLWASQKL